MSKNKHIIIELDTTPIKPKIRIPPLFNDILGHASNMKKPQYYYVYSYYQREEYPEGYWWDGSLDNQQNLLERAYELGHR
jgi:hypothetical protein